MLNNPIIQGTKLPILADPAVPGEVLAGKQLIDVNGNILTGTMPTVTAATPGINVSSSGLITATAQQAAGYVSAGTKTATQQLPTQGTAMITPGTTSKTAVFSGVYTTGSITVVGDSNLVASNIKKDVSIFGVVGSLEGVGSGITKTPCIKNSKNSNVFKFTLPNTLSPSDVSLIEIGTLGGNITNNIYFPTEKTTYVLYVQVYKNSNGLWKTGTSVSIYIGENRTSASVLVFNEVPPSNVKVENNVFTVTVHTNSSSDLSTFAGNPINDWFCLAYI